jgi:hypothetical protein
MFRFTFTLISLLFSATAFSQLIVEKGVTPKAGIYQNFSEFKHNNPSTPLPANYKIEEEKDGSDIISGQLLFGNKRPKESQ